MFLGKPMGMRVPMLPRISLAVLGHGQEHRLLRFPLLMLKNLGAAWAKLAAKQVGPSAFANLI